MGRRAVGFEHPAVKIFMPAGAPEPVYAPYMEYHPPDVNAGFRVGRTILQADSRCRPLLPAASACEARPLCLCGSEADREAGVDLFPLLGWIMACQTSDGLSHRLHDPGPARPRDRQSRCTPPFCGLQRQIGAPRVVPVGRFRVLGTSSLAALVVAEHGRWRWYTYTHRASRSLSGRARR
jgi:hypothetical protein